MTARAAALRLLFVVPYAPNPVRVRAHNLIRALAADGHALTVATLWEGEGELQDLEELRASGVTVVARRLGAGRKLINLARAVPSPKPLQSAFCWQPALAAALDSLTAGSAFDAAHVEHLRGAAYGLHLLRRGRHGPAPPVVWDAVDCISHLFSQAATGSRGLKARVMTRLELPRTRRHEAELVRAFPCTLVTSPVDRDALLALAEGVPAERLVVVPNGVDAAYFQPGPAAALPAPAMVVSGKMSYHANATMVHHLVREVMPLVWAERPETGLWIVGKDPRRELRRLATVPGARPPDAGGWPPRTVVVTGTVPDVRPYLRAATVAVAPVAYGAGIQNKVLEAMACGTAVVASPHAVAALDVTPGRELLVAAGAPEFARAVLDLLADARRRQLLAVAARRYVVERHSWAAAAERAVAAYRVAAGAP